MTAPQIPFRAEPAVDATYVLGVFVLTGLILLVAFVLISYARRKGWLDRWRVGGPGATLRTHGNSWSVDSQRISRRTWMHVVENGRDRLVIVESDANAAICRLKTADSGDEALHDGN